jgi:hypothetical protein
MRQFVAVAFSTPPEVQTFAALNHALAPLGYSISQKVRVLDCVRAAAENPKASTPVGSSLADFVVPGLREVAGSFGPAHPWFEEGDWRYAFSAHFDFVVHESSTVSIRPIRCSLSSSTVPVRMSAPSPGAGI